MEQIKEEKGSVVDYKDVNENSKVLKNEESFELDVDILISGARPYVINENNVDKVKAKIVAEAANIPIKPELEERLHDKGVWVIPDFLCNAGGVISSYVEYKAAEKKRCLKQSQRRLRKIQLWFWTELKKKTFHQENQQ